ncbi:MAG: LysM peptidoglycan-binding domain-containing protein [Bacilli bacterium]|nr:LysM peptidoglycan-binding domain-containing protein [Bacilli bacterium]
MYGIYIVKDNDTIESIANKYNISVEQLYEINGFEPMSVLEVGQRVIVPMIKPELFEYYAIKKGDTLYKLGELFKINPEKLAEINGLNTNEYIYEGQILIIPKEGVEITITKEGDTIDGLSKKLGTNSFGLLLQNPNIYVLPEQLITYKKVSNE